MAESAREAASSAASSAVEHGRDVVREATSQTRQIAAEVRDRVSDQARTQNERLVGGLRAAADQLDQMATEKPDSPARMLVQRIGESGRQAADYLERHGPDGVLHELQDFARRRPGVFLLAAVAAGFAAGRLGKGMVTASAGADQDREAGLYGGGSGMAYPPSGGAA